MTAAPTGDPARPVLSTGQYNSFMVRVFGREGEVLHCEVTHVATRRKQRFTDLSSALAFIATTIGQRPTVMEGSERD